MKGFHTRMAMFSFEWKSIYFNIHSCVPYNHTRHLPVLPLSPQKLTTVTDNHVTRKQIKTPQLRDTWKCMQHEHEIRLKQEQNTNMAITWHQNNTQPRKSISKISMTTYIWMKNEWMEFYYYNSWFVFSIANSCKRTSKCHIPLNKLWSALVGTHLLNTSLFINLAFLIKKLNVTAIDKIKN